MTDVSTQGVVKNHAVVVSLSGDSESVSIVVRAPSGGGTHELVNIRDLLSSGVPPLVAIQLIQRLVAIGISSAEFGNG
ncbi:hypothetical protein HI806_09620 [Ralstonia solanacearum]|nr:hypothetical protein HI806_09620 [Ralstonia solanacearum]QKL76731.1 hypothetical protein HI805_09630 [Ralstonia solanacearum]QKL81935.1 hypothetical protein HI804_09630 [Ralstonia solanacearum]QKL87146.1 hypothetical protein HI803_09635 [Ralstonia solanacearum]QKM02512.1 hypothetical protein HI800_09630 [Ralstonia solanacearum]